MLPAKQLLCEIVWKQKVRHVRMPRPQVRPTRGLLCWSVSRVLRQCWQSLYTVFLWWESSSRVTIEKVT